MKDKSKFQNRYRIPSNRLPGWDYNAEGAYFLTICCHKRECLFGEIVDQEMILNNFGSVVLTEWEYSARLRSEIELGPYIIMPNHFHAIVHIVENNREMGITAVPPVETHGRASLPQTPSPPQNPFPKCSIFPCSRLPKSIPSLIAGFKSVVTKQINLIRDTPDAKVWQSNYYDHIIRNNEEYQRITDYIQMNPECWQSDSFH